MKVTTRVRSWKSLSFGSATLRPMRASIHAHVFGWRNDRKARFVLYADCLDAAGRSYCGGRVIDMETAEAVAVAHAFIGCSLPAEVLADWLAERDDHFGKVMGEAIKI